MDNSITNGKTKVAIGSKRISKYSEYETIDINKTLDEYYKKYSQYHNTFDILDTPINKNQRLEREHKINRHSKLPFLEFIYPKQN